MQADSRSALLAPLDCQQPCVVLCGMLDGVHNGHRALLAALNRLAEQQAATPLVLTFDIPPRQALGQGGAELLQPLADRVQLLQTLTARVVVLQTTPQLLALPPQDFLQALADRVDLAGMVCGPNHTFGAHGRGTAEFLQAWCAQNGVACQVVPPVRYDGQPVSSSRIRCAVSRGDMPLAAALLGRPYTLQAAAVAGRGVASQHGVPTLNLPLPTGLVHPAFGVYACRVSPADQPGMAVDAVVNAGCGPTLRDGRAPRVEVHLLLPENQPAPAWADGVVTVEWVQKLRDEQVFDTPQLLFDQVRRDCQTARQVLKPSRGG